MSSSNISVKYVAFLRGINVGGHHKLPMSALSAALAKLGFEKIITILNSGNVIFECNKTDINRLEKVVSEKLEESFGFPVPTIIKGEKTILQLLCNSPFENVNVTNDIRLYVSFLKKPSTKSIEIPWANSDKSYQIVEKRENTIFSVLDLSITKTPVAMDNLEKIYGSDMTTRNWKTIERVAKKLDS